MSKPESPVGKSKVTITLLKEEEDIKNCIVVGGYFGLGRCGYLSINHLLKELDVRLIGHINTDFIPPFVSISNGRIRAPFELYRHNDLIIIATHFEPYKYEQRSFSETLVKWAKSNGVKHIVQIGGLDKRYQADEEFDACVVTSSQYDKEKLGPKIPLMDEGLYVTGPAALVMLYANFHNMPALLLLPFAERMRPDPKAAAKAIIYLNELYGFDINVDPLIDEGQSLEIEELGAKEIAERQELLNNADSGMFV